MHRNSDKELEQVSEVPHSTLQEPVSSPYIVSSGIFMEMFRRFIGSFQDVHLVRAFPGVDTDMYARR